MSSTANISDAKCVVCDSPTTHNCNACQLLTYCRKDCRSKDPVLYEALCKDIVLEKDLARVAELIQDAYLTFRENTWEGNILRVDDRKDALTIYDGNPWDNPQWFTKFQHDVVPTNKRAKLGVLTAWTCDEPYAFMNTLILKLLQDLDIDIEEIGVKLRRVPCKTVAIHHDSKKPHSNWPAYQHKLLSLTSRNSQKQWVMDLAGAQYGIVDPFHTWTRYKAEYVDKIVSVYELGAQNYILSELAKIDGTPSLAYGLVGKAAAQLDDAISTWESEHMRLSVLRALQDADFEQQKTSMLDALDEAVRDFITNTDFAAEVHKAKACDSLLVAQVVQTKAMQMSDEMNLMKHETTAKPDLTDLLLDKFSSMYGDEYPLDPGGLHGLYPIEIDLTGGEATEFRHIFS